MEKVVHCKRDKFDIYIGRPSKWGNPFTIGKDGTREEVIEKYSKWIATQPELLKDIPKLKDKILGCWCSPKSCHGDILVKLAKGEVMRNGKVCDGCIYIDWTYVGGDDDSADCSHPEVKDWPQNKCSFWEED